MLFAEVVHFKTLSMLAPQERQHRSCRVAEHACSIIHNMLARTITRGKERTHRMQPATHVPVLSLGSSSQVCLAVRASTLCPGPGSVVDRVQQLLCPPDTDSSEPFSTALDLLGRFHTTVCKQSTRLLASDEARHERLSERRRAADRPRRSKSRSMASTCNCIAPDL